MSMTPPSFEAPPDRPKRNWTTIAVVVGIVCMGSCLILVIFGAAVLLPVFAQARKAALRQVGISRMRQLSLGNLMYAEDNDQRLPIASKWMDAIASEVKSEKTFRSPGLNGLNGSADSFGISFMSSLSSVKVSSVKSPAKAVMLFDSTLLGRNANSGLETLPKPPRYGPGESGGNIFAFVDGHTARLDAVAEANLKSSAPTASQ